MAAVYVDCGSVQVLSEDAERTSGKSEGTESRSIRLQFLKVCVCVLNSYYNVVRSRS